MWVGQCERAATVSVNTASTGCVWECFSVSKQTVFLWLNMHICLYLHICTCNN